MGGHFFERENGMRTRHTEGPFNAGFLLKRCSEFNEYYDLLAPEFVIWSGAIFSCGGGTVLVGRPGAPICLRGGCFCSTHEASVLVMEPQR